MSSNIKLSVLVPVFNGQQYISKKINNLIKNFGSQIQLEVLISVNKSQDESKAILKKYEQSLPENFKIWYQNKTLNTFENFRFLLSESKGKWIYFTAVDDCSLLEFSNPICDYFVSDFNEIAIIGKWHYENEIHGKGETRIELSGPLSQRIKNLQSKIRVSHGIFYCITSNKIWNDFFTKFDPNIIGVDWLFNLYLVTRGPLRYEDGFESCFAVNGVSRQADAFKLQGATGFSYLFPYWKLIVQSTKILYEVRNLRPSLEIIKFILFLIKGNIHRFIFSNLKTKKHAKFKVLRNNLSKNSNLFH